MLQHFLVLRDLLIQALTGASAVLSAIRTLPARQYVRQFVNPLERLLRSGSVQGFHQSGDFAWMIGVHPVDAHDKAV